MKDLWNTITAAGTRKPYGAICTEELSDREAVKDSPCLKCTDNLYLVIKDTRPQLYDRRRPEAGLQDPGGFDETGDLADFATELSFAPDVILPAQFSLHSLKLADETFPLTARKVSEKLYALQIEGGEDLILFDASRFLLYAFISGKLTLGYAEV